MRNLMKRLKKISGYEHWVALLSGHIMQNLVQWFKKEKGTIMSQSLMYSLFKGALYSVNGICRSHSFIVHWILLKIHPYCYILFLVTLNWEERQPTLGFRSWVPWGEGEATTTVVGTIDILLHAFFFPLPYSNQKEGTIQSAAKSPFFLKRSI